MQVMKQAVLMGLAAGLILTPPVYAKCKWGLLGCNEGGDRGAVQNLQQNLHPHYETNKFDLKARQEAGGWILAWSDDISETDAIQGVVAAGVSIYSGGSSFALWIRNLVQRTIQSTMRSAGARFPG
jgi:hypothetical protein